MACNFIKKILSRCTIWSSELFFTWKYNSCSITCSFIFVTFSSQVGILIFISSFSSNQFDKIENVPFFQNLIKLIWSSKNVSNFAAYIIKFIWCISGPKKKGLINKSVGFKFIKAIIHGFRISVPVLILSIFWQLLLRNGKILSICLFWNEWT